MRPDERTHPHPDPAHIMLRYRGYLTGQKRVWMAPNPRAKRCLRGLIRYREYVSEYLASKRLVVARHRLRQLLTRYLMNRIDQEPQS